MKFSEQWLREWVNPALTSLQLAEQLTMAGLEVEARTEVAAPFSGVVTGQVIHTVDHPNASRLKVCQVKVGDSETLSIVCGAHNVQTGLKVAVALLGAILPSGIVIKTATLRGVSSKGLLCSTSELGLTETATGLMELPDEAPVGIDLWQYLQLTDQCFDIHVTPNRGDCLSIAGLAREIAALNDMSVQAPVFSWSLPTIPDTWPVQVMVPLECPRYLGRIISGLNAQAQTPIWMRERLRRSGLHSSHPVVDVTNYVLLEMGQPLHAFDQRQLQQGIWVRRAETGETLKLLNGQQISLEAGTLVIADQQQVQAVAGIMGGYATAVCESTESIFLESAFFDPVALAGRARYYGINSEAAYRFERGVDPERCRAAIERASQLLLAISGGQLGPVIEISSPTDLPAPTVITLRLARIQSLLGIHLTEHEVEIGFRRLGMEVHPQEGGWQVNVPSWRFDLRLEVDLLGELTRIYGYDRLPAHQPKAPLVFSSLPETALLRLRHFWVDRGYHEAISYSFTSLKSQQWLDSAQPPLLLSNPLSSDLAVLRMSLWPGLLQAASYNQKRQQLQVRLFEMGLCFLNTPTGIQQPPRLAGVVTGSACPEQWGSETREADFFDVKNDVEAYLALTRVPNICFSPDQRLTFLHPRHNSAILSAGNPIGYLGALHPRVLAAYGLIGPIYVFELALEVLTPVSFPHFKPFSKFPFIRRDLCFWVDESLPLSVMLAVMRDHAGEWLLDLLLFDVYSDLATYPGKRSVALGLFWQHLGRTLVDKEVDVWLNHVVDALQRQFNIQLREER